MFSWSSLQQCPCHFADYIDNQYHIVESWLGRFYWFRRKQQLHFIHHCDKTYNFAVIDFFWDRLLGTYLGVGSGGFPVTSVVTEQMSRPMPQPRKMF
jgi:sterol desaturase/sphingolipid hydroxylase (fatty acid hydroxylase superfamily)